MNTTTEKYEHASQVFQWCCPVSLLHSSVSPFSAFVFVLWLLLSLLTLCLHSPNLPFSLLVFLLASQSCSCHCSLYVCALLNPYFCCYSPSSLDGFTSPIVTVCSISPYCFFNRPLALSCRCYLPSSSFFFTRTYMGRVWGQRLLQVERELVCACLWTHKSHACACYLTCDPYCNNT